MADIQLNKPLYKSGDDSSFKQPIPRPPKANIIGRAAAIFLDVMLLHLLFGMIVRFAPAIPLSLGEFAPWVGILLGFAYFTIGFSDITLGRTMGKLITRVQVADIAGPDLPLNRAALRAALLLWPLPVQIVISRIAEYHAANDPTSIYTTIEVFGIMLIIGWILGNLVFASLDPHGRTVYDRLAGSVVINAELEQEPMAAYMAEVRTANQQPPQRRSILGLGFALTGCLAIATVIAMNLMTQLRDLTPEQRSRAEDMVLPGYGRAMPAPPVNNPETTATVPVSFHFRSRSPIEVSALKADPATSATLDRLVNAVTGPQFIGHIREYISSANLERGKRGELPMDLPSNIQFEVSFVEYADMFWAREPHQVYTLSRKIDIPTTLTQMSTPGD